MDLIDRQTAIDALRKLYILDPRIITEYSYDMALDKADCVLKAIPSADVQPVRHGHWIIKDNPGTGWYRVTCSECGEDVTSVAPVIGFFPKAKVIWDFCPECGTRMDGE